jgi:phenylpropionate dioxygenase-like ring-hydroxylating dioxygenase large terminal subunit
MDTQTRNFPLNCWWVAATAAEVTRTPLQRWLLERPVVLYRKEDGTAVALDDRCPHRWAPLSDGKLEGDNIVCPYHGARFTPEGQCTQFSTTKVIPSAMRVRTYALVERGPFIWIWMGDDAVREQTALPPDFPWVSNPAWTYTLDHYEFAANYMLLHENVLDLTHFNTLHANSFKIVKWKPAPRFDSDGDRVGYESVHESTEFDEQDRIAMGLAHPDALRTTANCWFETPALHQAESRVYYKEGSTQPPYTRTYINHMVTPVDATHTHYWWLVGTDVDFPEEARKGFATYIATGYHEDKVMLESIQRMINRDGRGRDYVEVSVQNDAGAVMARRALARILAAEDKVKEPGAA